MNNDIRDIIKQGLQENRKHNYSEKARQERERANEYPMEQPEDLVELRDRVHLNKLLNEDNIQTLKTFYDRLRESFADVDLVDKETPAYSDNHYVVLLHINPNDYIWRMASNPLPDMNWRSFKNVKTFDRIAIIPFNDAPVSDRSWVNQILMMSRIAHPTYGTFTLFDDNGKTEFDTRDEAIATLRKVFSIYYKIPQGRILHRLPLCKSRWDNWGFQAKDDQNRLVYASGFRWETKEEAQKEMHEWGNKYRELMS